METKFHNIVWVSTVETKQDGIILKYQLGTLQEKFIYNLLQNTNLSESDFQFLKIIYSNEEYVDKDRGRLNELRIKYKTKLQ